MPVVCSSCQKYLGIDLDEKLNLFNHIKEKMSKAILKGLETLKSRRW